ncbi:HPP family protein [Methylobacillus caricis]|uniref:HPP family protein n=1 Tax=Methylobacillus caricis TaxID=1971611 RepID=UPI001CFFD60F|nr:HPP family protein [Methylobacillus caricis]MCB5187906.1 HPP family protein [Methylobacillus caricis]
MSLIQKLKGDGADLPVRPGNQAIALAWLGGFLAIAVVAILSDAFATTLVLGSFGASCVLVFGYPDLPFAQPRNVVLGHVLSSLIGLLFLSIFGFHWWSLALAVATAIALMMYTRTTHPPAGSNPVIVFLILPGWNFLIFPTLFGSLLIVLVALIYNNISRKAKYPKYW